MTEPIERVALAPAPAQSPAPDAAAPVMWVLAVGVSRYADASLNLSFAERDARAIAKTLRQQQGGRLYRDVRTRVLTNEQVTRESVLSSLDTFFSQAGTTDVVTVFLAGHGVQDRATRSYYFLPYAANAENLVTAGLRISDFDEMVRAVRRNVQAVVLMLDTCHAGALSSEGVAAEDLVARLSVGEGFYLLAATKPGEEAREQPELRHGAFTYALLEGLRGAADSDHDGVVSVSDLFGYVARRVPLLTGGNQHPYHKLEGTDLNYAAVMGGAAVAGATTPTPETGTPPPVDLANATPENTIGVLQFTNLRGDESYDWIGKALRIAFNTELSKVRALRVYSPELIDRTAATRHTDSLMTAQHLGLNKLVTGAYQVVGKDLRIDAHIVDVSTGVQQGSDSVQGEVNGFFDMQKQLVLSMLRRLPVPFSTEEGESIKSETNTDVNAYRLLLEAEGVVDDAAPKRSPAIRRAQKPTAEPQSYVPGDNDRADSGFAQRLRWLRPAAALAGETPDAQARALVERYRQALETKKVAQVAELTVSFSARQREALQAYFDNANDLQIEMTDIAVMTHDEQLSVSFTRRDRFTDRESNRPVRLEVRLTKTVVRENGTWKLGR